MPIITIEQIVVAEDSTIINNLQVNSITTKPDPIINKLLLLKALAIFLPLKDKERLYSTNFDELFLEYKGQITLFNDKLIPGIIEYEYSIDSTNVLDTRDSEDLGINYTDLDNLYLAAGIAELDVTQPPNVIYTQFMSMLPSMDWQRNVVTSLPPLLNDETYRLMGNYLSNAFISINERLRNYSIGNALLNRVIEGLSPIDRDIVVFRVINRPINKLPDKGIFKSLGYLSTSIAYYNYADILDKKRHKIQLLKIYVPKGKKAIFIPGRELELVFPHNIELEVLNRTDKTFVSVKKENMTVDLYEMRML